MKPVEQAIFSSNDVEHDASYRIVDASSGVLDDDARELKVWQASRDALSAIGPDAESLNFHPLPSGVYCVSRAVSAGWDHGGAQRVHTHCLMVPPEVLARFANNPFSLARSMTEHGLWHEPGMSLGQLEPLFVPGGATPVDEPLLNELARDPGPEFMAALVQAARDSLCLAVAGASRPMAILAGLFSCLPPECRLEFSFSTGLKFSPRRPFRIVALSDDPAERLWVGNYSNVAVLDLKDATAAKSMPWDGWSQWIERALAADQVAFLASQISKRRFDLSLDDLPALGLQLLENMDDADQCVEEAQTPRANLPAVAGQRAHAAHRQFAKSLATTATAAAAAKKLPAALQIAMQSPEVLEKLEHLDDLVYEAISGQTHAFEQLQAAWPKLFDELGADLLAESREHYLRYALSIWEECVNSGGVRNPARAIRALDVLCLLFADAQ